MCSCGYHGHIWRSGDCLKESLLSFYYLSPRDQTQVTGLGDKCLSSLSPLGSPAILLFVNHEPQSSPLPHLPHYTDLETEFAEHTGLIQGPSQEATYPAAGPGFPAVLSLAGLPACPAPCESEPSGLGSGTQACIPATQADSSWLGRGKPRRRVILAELSLDFPTVFC